MERFKQIWQRIVAAAKCAWHDHSYGRMVQWAIFSVLLYVLVLGAVWPLVLQAALTKAANVNAGAFLGYWVDRSLFSSFDAKFNSDPDGISPHAKAARVVSRGLIVAACIIGLSMGLSA